MEIIDHLIGQFMLFVAFMAMCWYGLTIMKALAGNIDAQDNVVAMSMPGYGMVLLVLAYTGMFACLMYVGLTHTAWCSMVSLPILLVATVVGNHHYNKIYG